VSAEVAAEVAAAVQRYKSTAADAAKHAAMVKDASRRKALLRNHMILAAFLLTGVVVVVGEYGVAVVSYCK
jgi:hypothetical protein